ncbi:Ig-like domain-containing protein [Microbacterium neungamense]|uniref:Ig-like domain-containing protein n=1 Tax=Microbacterium neungamense TaxID=2810535 RepID=UPI00217EC140|nr:Ig-like domain-containing protein [Microbacterium neungamense]UWF77716.1 tandem-95 repeat protein [Microbacterium neungamense]
MKAMSWLRARPKTLASAAGVTAGVVAITTMAFSYDGFPTTKVDLHDGGVWITKSSSLLVGHFNNESTVLDGGLRTSGEDFDILQDGTNVVVVDKGNAAITAVDPARIALGDSTGVPGSAEVALGNETVAVLDRRSGELWVVPVKGIAGFEIEGAEPVAELGEVSDVVVARDGTVFGVSGSRGEVVTVPVDAEGAPLEPAVSSVGELEGPVQVTAVGRVPVVLDAAGVVTTPGGFRTEIGAAEDAVLQYASAPGDAVAVATGSSLVRVPLDGGEPQVTDAGGSGSPAVPVSLRGCVYGAWAGSAMFVRECPGESSDVVAGIEGAEGASSLTFRVNRDVIILNDAVGGAAWTADESLQRVDNWNDITPPEGETENEEETTEETVETTLPERSEVNTPPVAEDDSFGVRPGGTAVLPVLDNDNDPDGDVLVATVTGEGPSLGSVQPIHNGASLQMAVEEDASGSASFGYEADDGRGGKDTATVTVSVHDWDQNGAPVPKRKTTLAVESGGTVSYNILPDWIDPDGDDIYLKEVIAAPGDEVDFTTDGQITYHAVASLQGRKDVQVTVADGLGETATGTIVLDVRPPGTTDPKTNADHVVTRVGEQVTVSPLANDTSSGREPLRLARVDEVPGATVQADFANKTFTFSAPAPGVYYVQYLVTAGAKNGRGIVRVDVTEAADKTQPPVAVRDVALLPIGGDVLIGVLGNDTDPAGGILVVQSVTVEPGSGISVSVLNHETLRITDQGALDEQVRLTYRISNGAQSAEGEVVVIPIPAPDEILPPVANDDQVVVRAGDVVTIPVLDNDTHPNDDAMHVAPELIEPLVDPEDGEAFVSQDTVRFKAGPEAKTVYATYEVVDSRQQKDAGYITIQILPVNEEKNAAPRPRDITARALAGTEVNIAVPLDGIDEDGDSVELLGLASSPTKGRITETAQNYFSYEAFDDSSGVDTFTYRVRDRLGKEGTATIRVGIAPAEQANQAPYAVKDAVVVRPGREIAVPVLENDSDPEGDQVALVKNGLETPEVGGLSARVSGDRVLVQAPDRAVETSLQYTITDSRGATATAVLQITVDEDVPLQAPIARDDRVLPTDIAEDSLVAEIDILGNDEDPDGTTEALELEVGEGATVQKNGTVRVTVREEMQLIRYTLTDQDGLAASAFIFVPAVDGLRPTLTSTKPVEVVSGETKELPLDDYVTVAGGGSVVITEHAKVTAAHADGSNLVKDERTLVYTSAPGYFGEDGLTFEVTDGTGPDDPEGRKATLTIPITVLPPDNQQPTFVSGEVNVSPGEDATVLDLGKLTTDPDPEDAGKHRYTLVDGEGSGVSASIDGDKLSVQASSNARKGTGVTLTLRISDGETEPIEGTVTVRVTASNRAMPAANTDTIAEADQGESITVPVLANDFNPFPETPLKILSAATESGEGRVDVRGDEVVVTPGAKFVGTLVVAYRIQDATEDPDREANGKIVVTVQGVPEAPGTPSVTSVQDRTVVVSFTPPSNNGAEITHYTVRSVQGNPYSKQCSSTTCTLDGLTNNVEYAFQVTATNRVGESEPSGTSEPARPDARPDTPNPPTLAFGDKSLKVAWTTPTTPGSPVDRYTLEISPVPPSGIAQKETTGNSLVWEGLENGTSYKVRVQAHNRAPEPSSWSAWSTAEIPAGPPLQPAAPTTQELAPVGDRAQMQVNWVAPNSNGDAIDGYQLDVLRGGTVVDTLYPAAGATSQAVVVDTSETAYTYRIRAQNKAGWGEFSPPSAERRGVIAPDPPRLTAVHARDRALGIEYTPGDRNGARTTEVSYQYRLNGGGWAGLPGNQVIGGLTNGTRYTVELRAVSNVGGSAYASGPSNAISEIPYGPPHAPVARARNLGTSVELSWNARVSDNGRAIVLTQININGNGWRDAAIEGSVVRGNGYNETHSIQVRAQDAAGQWTPVASASATTNAPPAPEVWVTQGDPAPESCVNGCRMFVVNWKNLNIGSKQVWCKSSAYGTIGSSSHTVNFDGSGSTQISCWQGRDGVDVWVDIAGWGDDVDTEKRFWPRP